VAGAAAPWRPLSPARAGLLVAGTACVLVAPHLGVPMLLYPLWGLGLCAAMLRWQGLGFADLGVRWRGAGVAPLLLGGALGLAYAALNYLLVGPVLAMLTGALPDLSAFAFVRRSLPGYLLACAAAWAIGGFYEELVFRGFLHAMLVRHLPAWRARTALAVALTALAFALYHVQLGRFGMANALVFALFAAAVRGRWPGNLWYAISFHACADVSAFTLIRLGWL
jgi:membrane protease YdiL (CAAX protease family)